MYRKNSLLMIVHCHGMSRFSYSFIVKIHTAPAIAKWSVIYLSSRLQLILCLCSERNRSVPILLWQGKACYLRKKSSMSKTRNCLLGISHLAFTVIRDTTTICRAWSHRAGDENNCTGPELILMYSRPIAKPGVSWFIGHPDPLGPESKATPGGSHLDIRNFNKES